MDIIYKQSFGEQNVSLLGQQIFQAFMRIAGTEAVRERAQFIGKYIDNLYDTKHVQTQLNVLNVACGHVDNFGMVILKCLHWIKILIVWI